MSGAIPSLAPAAASLDRDLFFGSESPLDNVLVAFEAVCIADRAGQESRLFGCARVPHRRIAGAHQFGRYASRKPDARMAVDAVNLLGGMERSHIRGLSGGCALVEG